MNEFQWETAEEIDLELAKRMRLIRKRKGFSQEMLSRKSGVSLGSVKRFESSGMISLISLTKIAIALCCVNEIKQMFSEVPYRSIEEVINENK